MLRNFSLTLAIELFDLLLQSIVQGQTTIFYYNPSGLNCNWLWLQQTNLTTNPQFVWHTSMPYSHLKDQQNSDIFVLACISSEHIESDLMGLSQSLSHLREVKVFVEVMGAPHESSELSMASRVLRLSLQQSMLNVIVYFHRFPFPNIYSYVAYPEFILIKRNLSAKMTLYRGPLEVLQGFPLRVMPDFSEPSTFEYLDVQGQHKMAGYLWAFATNFADKLGANIQVIRPTWVSSRSLLHVRDNMEKLAYNGSLDLGLLTMFVFFTRDRKLHHFSYPVFYASWCTMLPVERPISTTVLIQRVLKCGAMSLVFLIWMAFILVKPYWKRLKWLLPKPSLYLFPSILYLFLKSAYISQLVSMIIGRPQESPIDSFDDLLASGLHIFGMRAEFDGLDGDFRAKYASAFTLTNNPTELYIRRNFFNTSFGYTISTTKWRIMEIQQRHFAHPVFRFSEKLCFHSSTVYSLIINENCVFREALTHYIMVVYQSGLMDHWMTNSFYDMVKAGYMHIKDLSTINHVQPLRLEDYRFAHWCCCLGLLLAFVVFVLELMRHWVSIFLDSL